MPIPEDFTFPNQVDDVATLPPEAKALYTKNAEGKYDIDPVMKKRLDVSPLQSSLQKERKLREAHEKTLNGFKSLGLGDTPEEALANIKKYEESDEDEDTPDDKKEKRQTIKAMREQLKAEFEDTLSKTVTEKDAALSKMQQSLKKHLIEKEAISALAKFKGNDELLRPHVMNRLALIEEDGEYVVRVMGTDGEPMGDGRGGFKTVEAFVQDMRNDAKFKIAFEASGKSGSGASGSGPGKPGSIQGAKTSIDKIAAGLENIR